MCCSVREGKRLEIPHNCRPDYKELIEKCWAHDANDRADFEEVGCALYNIWNHGDSTIICTPPSVELLSARCMGC